MPSGAAGRGLDAVHRLLARSGAAVWCALKLRNQCQAVIGHRLGGDSSPQRNGEAWLIGLVAPRVESFVDVGANRGDWSALLLERAGRPLRGICFEPGRAALPLLLERLSAFPGVEVRPEAVGDREGEAGFCESDGAGEHSGIRVGGGTSRTVHVTTLDRAIPWPRIDVLKIDSEGYDCRVLEGAAGLLRERRIGVVQFEYNSMWAAAGSTLAGALRILGDAGYRTYRLAPGRLEPVDYDRYGEYFRYANHVAVSPAWLTCLEKEVRA